MIKLSSKNYCNFSKQKLYTIQYSGLRSHSKVVPKAFLSIFFFNNNSYSWCLYLSFSNLLQIFLFTPKYHPKPFHRFSPKFAAKQNLNATLKINWFNAFTTGVSKKRSANDLRYLSWIRARRIQDNLGQNLYKNASKNFFYFGFNQKLRQKSTAKTFFFIYFGLYLKFWQKNVCCFPFLYKIGPMLPVLCKVWIPLIYKFA